MKLSGENLSKNVQSALEEVLKQRGFSEETMIEVTHASGTGDNYIGELVRVAVSEGEKHENLIIKVQPQDSRQELFSSNRVWKKEGDFYTKVMRTLDNFQKSKGICVFNSLPVCYGAFPNCIILQDLKDDGYEVGDRIHGLTYDELKLILTQLSKFHSLSFAYRDQNPQGYEELMDASAEMLVGQLLNKDLFDRWLETHCKPITDMFEEGPLKEKLKIKLENIFESTLNAIEEGQKDEHICINHGDCWVNNFMFKYREGQPESVMFIDFQMFRSNSPVTDISYLICCGTETKLRREHMSELMSYYLTSLHENIQLLGSDPNHVYPKSVFKQHFTKYSILGALMTVLALPQFLASKEEIPDMKEYDLTNVEEMKAYGEKKIGYYKNEFIKERVVGVLTDLLDRDYF